jgi:hypothetical protein
MSDNTFVNWIHRTLGYFARPFKTQWGTRWDAASNLGTDIETLIDSIVTLTETGGTVTADGTEQNIAINDAPVGVYKPFTIKVSLINMGAADVTEFKVYDRISSGGPLELVDYQQYTGVYGGLADSKTVFYISLKENRWGWKVTLKQTAIGVYRDYIWEYIYE